MGFCSFYKLIRVSLIDGTLPALNCLSGDLKNVATTSFSLIRSTYLCE